MENKKHICCKHIFNKEKPILLVVKMDSYFQFMCGSDHAENDEPELIDLDEILRFDKSIENVLELKVNHQIERESLKDYWALSYYDEN